ncbi:MAG TPA: hypothetical protein VM166_14800 [Gemmatimonadaceae bacterium]|nr:hypothetical protein [Gemmatimonadaceae bacterium]
MTQLVGATRASSAGAKVTPAASANGPSAASPAEADRSTEASNPSRSTRQGESPSPTVAASSPKPGARTTGSRTTATRDSGGKVLSTAEVPQRTTNSQSEPVSRDQPSPAPARTATRDVPATSPAPRTSTRGSSARTIPAGTNLVLRSDATICTNTNKVGQSFAAALTQDLKASDGSTIAAGARAVLEITELKRSEEAGDPITMGFRVTSVASGGRTFFMNAPAQSASIARVRRPSRTSDATKVATGAALGAAVGQAVGRDAKSAVTGAAVGAAVGAAAAQASASYEGCVPTGGRINARVAE